MSTPMASESETMLPCPFCGGSASMSGGGEVSVRCDDCPVEVYAYYETPTEASAIQNWNRRAPSAEAKDAERDGSILAEVSSIEDQIAAGEMCARRVFTRMRYMLRNALEHRKLATAQDASCEWRDAEGVWHTSCGQVWSYTDGGPADNHANFCHCCGKTLAIAEQGAAAGHEVGR